MALFKLNLCTVIGLLLLALASWAVALPANASETTKGYVNDVPIRLKSTTSNNVKTTKGYVGDQYIRMKSTTTKSGTVTKGYVDGKYVKVKVRKD